VKPPLMLLPPFDLNSSALRALVAEQYGGNGGRLEFEPRGEDSWSYRLGDLWVSVRRDLRGHVSQAYEAAAEMARSGLDFVLAPLAGADGRVVHSVGAYPVVVFPYLDLVTLDDSPPSGAEVDEVVDLLATVHAAHIDTTLPRETFTLPFDADLDVAVNVADGLVPSRGPYGPRLRELLRRHRTRLVELRAEFRLLAQRGAENPGSLCLTHGEPIRSNLVRCGAKLLIADWGDLMWGPPERDWSHVIRTIGGAPACRGDMRRMYDVRWVLSEVAEYSAALAGPHTGDEDDAAMWRRLLRYLPES
jgi:spectinomycin phosphotransferase